MPARPTARASLPSVLCFIVAAFVFSGVFLQVQPATGLEPDALSLVQFGPAVAAGVVWLCWRTRMRDWIPSPVPARQFHAHNVLLIVACVVFFGIGAACAAVAGTGFTGPVASAGMPFGLYLVVQLIGAAGEEAGWRGMLQPLLETRMGRFTACLVTGLVWAVWHVQIFAAQPVVLVSFIVSTVSIAVLLGYFAGGGFWQRTFTGAIGHWLINIALYLVSGNDTLGYPQAGYYAIAGVVTTALALIVFGAARRRRAAAAGPAS